MSEAEALEALYVVGDQAHSYFGLWISLTGAYLTVAYIAGATLSRFQARMVSALYALVGAQVAVAAQMHNIVWIELNSRVPTGYANFAPPEFVWKFGLPIFLASAMLASLYFMYNVRDTGTAT